MSKQEKMFQLIEEYRNSGFTIKAFCEDRDIKAATFNYWIKKKKEASSAGGFVTINPQVPSNADLELIYPNGVRLRTGANNLDLVKRLLELY